MTVRNKLYKFLQEFMHRQHEIIIANYNYGVVLESITVEHNPYFYGLKISVVLFDEYNYSHVKHIKFSLDKSIYHQVYEFLKWFSDECDLNFSILEDIILKYWGKEGVDKTVKKLQTKLLIEKLTK